MMTPAVSTMYVYKTRLFRVFYVIYLKEEVFSLSILTKEKE